MRKIRSKLSASGFSEVKKGLFLSVYESFIYYVFFKRNGYGNIEVGLSITNANFYEGSADVFEVDKDYTPLHGFYSERGVSWNGKWKNDENNIERLFVLVNKFFSSIRNYDEFKIILKDHHLSEWQIDRLNRSIPEKKFEFADKYICADTFPAKSFEAVTLDLKNIFLPIFKRFGFIETDDPLLYVKKRNSNFFDCFYLKLDKYGLFFSVICFPWVTDWWRIEKSLKGKYWPIVSFDLLDNNGLVSIFDTGDVDLFDSELVSGWVNKLMPLSEAVNTKSNFIELMSSDWNHLALKFSRHLNR